ncbi:MAG: winged helix-turn-helix domain-containing protein [Candidatus Bathyarchaeota archaeon]|nr:winged helix-turn-helix domain-containing protein [Candidatus Bathyarchaeota archaeon]
MKLDFPSGRRGSLVITVTILRAAKKGMLKTHLLSSVSLSCEQFNRYLGFLKAKGFVEEYGRLYKTTAKGLELISEFESSPLTRSVLTT